MRGSSLNRHVVVLPLCLLHDERIWSLEAASARSCQSRYIRASVATGVRGRGWSLWTVLQFLFSLARKCLSQIIRHVVRVSYEVAMISLVII